MRAPDADIPKESQGELTLLVADAGGSPLVLRHRLVDDHIDDPAFQKLPVHLRIAGLSEDAVERVSTTLRDDGPDAPLRTRAGLLATLP